MKYQTRYITGDGTVIEENDQAAPRLVEGSIWVSKDSVQYVVAKAPYQRVDGIFENGGGGVGVEKYVGVGKQPSDYLTLTAYTLRRRRQNEIDDELRAKKNAETARNAFTPMSARARRGRDNAEHIEISDGEDVIVLRRRSSWSPETADVKGLTDIAVVAELRKLADRLEAKAAA